MSKVLPHEFFRIDFDNMLEVAKRQEEIDSANNGEYAIAKGIHGYFDKKVLPAIASDRWVFEAANRFASEFAIDCFRWLRLGSNEVYNAQRRLHETKARVKELLTKAVRTGAIKAEGVLHLDKASDFYSILEHNRLSKTMRNEAAALYEQAQDEESLVPTVILRAIRDLYEDTLPRVMYVVRRAVKSEFGLTRKNSDEKLLGISESMDFYSNNIDYHHPLNPVLGKLSDFYRVARNVGSHHQGLKWEPDKNEIILQDQDPKSSPLVVPLLEFQQRYRYLVYLSECGVRGIVCGFCECEHGETSNWLVTEYVKTFPEDFPVDDPEGVVAPYPG